VLDLFFLRFAAGHITLFIGRNTSCWCVPETQAGPKPEDRQKARNTATVVDGPSGAAGTSFPFRKS